MVELEAGDALSRRRDGRFRELSELATIDEGLQNVLLHVQVIVIDRREGIAENREIFDRFVHAVVVDRNRCCESLLFASHQLIAVTPVRVIVRIAIVAAVRIKASTETTAIQTTVADTAAIYRDPMAVETAVTHCVAAVAHCVAKAVTSAAMASTAVASTAASCKRGCADRRCRYAERDGRSRCNYLFAHFSKLLMFHLISVRGLPKRGATRSLGLAVSARRSCVRRPSTKASRSSPPDFCSPSRLVQLRTNHSKTSHSGRRLNKTLDPTIREKNLGPNYSRNQKSSARFE